ncbi:unnamed protein product [Vitrella brassicaformis CCMP3155]|uniref:Uncharacterized protein n=2 Tax=Vitrella brassicaformis TaxID=1169539 RepID=A0A0G4EKD3_VITBC|nr:unnamed protein product [Vitrella brassicaformis CCMP3155]|eukprot:CEL97905.1 unnamed protein product [Vitrella brassicaformis CCMP3155]
MLMTGKERQNLLNAMDLHTSAGHKGFSELPELSRVLRGCPPIHHQHPGEACLPTLQPGQGQEGAHPSSHRPPQGRQTTSTEVARRLGTYARADRSSGEDLQLAVRAPTRLTGLHAAQDGGVPLGGQLKSSLSITANNPLGADVDIGVSELLRSLFQAQGNAGVVMVALAGLLMLPNSVQLSRGRHR